MKNILVFKSFPKIYATVFISLLFPFISLFGQTVKASIYGFNETDNRKSIYQAVKNNDTIIIDKQNSDWLVSPLTFRNLENKTIIFEKNAVLRAKPKAYKNTSDCLLKFVNSKNIKILGENTLMQMNKEEYIDGEWRMGISLMGCKNFLIENLKISSSGGDGIYIDGYKTIRFSENIRINNIVSTNNKRQGISIISAKNVWIKNSTFTKTKGTLPEAGLDLEPDKETNVLVNINFENCSFEQNNHAGIVLSLENLTSQSEPISINFKDCYLSMNHDASNKYPAAEIVISSHPTEPVKGDVLFKDMVINKSNWGLLYSRKPSNGYQVVFENLCVSDICKYNLEEPTVVYLEVPDYYKTSGPIGGFTFKNAYFDFEASGAFFTIKGSSLRTLKGVKDVTGDITISNPNLTEFIDYIKYESEDNINFNVDFTSKF